MSAYCRVCQRVYHDSMNCRQNIKINDPKQVWEKINPVKKQVYVPKNTLLDNDNGKQNLDLLQHVEDASIEDPNSGKHVLIEVTPTNPLPILENTIIGGILEFNSYFSWRWMTLLGIALVFLPIG